MGNQQTVEAQHDAWADREYNQRQQQIQQYPEFIPYTRSLNDTMNYTERAYNEGWHKDEKYR